MFLIITHIHKLQIRSLTNVPLRSTSSPLPPPLVMPSLVISPCTSHYPPNAPFSSIPQRLELSFDGTVGDRLYQGTEAHTDEVRLSRPPWAHTLIKCSLIRIQWYCKFAGKGGWGAQRKAFYRKNVKLRSHSYPSLIALLLPLPLTLQLSNPCWPFFGPRGLVILSCYSITRVWGDWQQHQRKICRAKCVGRREERLCLCMCEKVSERK